MRFDRLDPRRTTLSAFGLLTASLLLASASPLAAQLRAAGRWNHLSGGESDIANAQAPAPADHEAGETRTIRLNEVFGELLTFIDVGEPGEGLGDYVVFHDDLTQPSTGATLGTLDVQCILAYADQCRGTISLTGRGQITFDGTTPAGVDPDLFAITGGTGQFVGAEGSLTVSFPAEDYARLTIRLLVRD